MLDGGVPLSYRLYIDSVEPADWDFCRRGGWLHGITTNPSILAQAGRKVDLATAETLVAGARERGINEIQLQATGEDATTLLVNGRALRALSDRVTVKVPATAAGFEAAAALCSEGTPVTMTACYSAHQAMLAASIGASFVAPYYGRMVEQGLDADNRLAMMRTVAQRSGRLRVLVASVRSLAQLETLLGQGFDSFTLSPAMARLIGLDAQSDAAAADFMRAAASARGG